MAAAAVTASADAGAAVAAHYNAVPEKGIDERTKSRIFYLRNFNNWVKSMLIGEFLKRIREADGRRSAISVLDLACGKGGDLLKWKKGNIASLVCADIADVSLDQCKSRYEENKDRLAQERRPQSIFSAQFIHADCSKVRLKDKYDPPDTVFHLCSCQFSLHYAFATEEQARCMLRNACESLKPGGFFIGTIPNCPLLVSECRKAPDREFKNDVCSAKFDDPSILDKKGPPLFGATYRFTLDEVVMDCPEYLIHFPLLEHLLKELDMELVYKKTFQQILEELGAQGGEGRGLLGRMQALEPYPPDTDVPLMGPGDSYSHAKRQMEEAVAKGTRNPKLVRYCGVR